MRYFDLLILEIYEFLWGFTIILGLIVFKDMLRVLIIDYFVLICVYPLIVESLPHLFV